MRSEHIKGATTIANISIGFTSIALMSWMGFVTTGVIQSSKDVVALATQGVNIVETLKKIETKQDDLMDTLDLIAPRLGVNPRVVDLVRSNNI